jgi:hypothetical protein
MSTCEVLHDGLVQLLLEVRQLLLFALEREKPGEN